MIENIIKLVAVTAVIAYCSADEEHKHSNLANPEVVFQWDWLKFKGLNHSTSESSYNPRNAIIYDIEIFRHMAILTTPRLRKGVPYTLVVADDSNDDKHNKHNKSPQLRPFPEAKAQTPGDCRDLQNVISIEQDTQGRLWVLDAGVLYVYEEKPDWKCPPKLIIYDLKKLGHPEVERYVFPEEDIRKEKTILADLTLQKTGTGDRDWNAYISDVGGYGIIVFNLKKTSSYRVEDSSMKPEKKAGTVEINKKKYDISRYGVSGIVFDKNLDKIYYNALAGYKIYSIPGRVLRNKKLATNKKKLRHIVKVEGRKESHSDCMTGDSEGRLYFGLLEKNTDAVWSPAYKLSPKTAVKMARDKPTQWLATYAIKGCWLYIVSNRNQQVLSGEGLNKKEINNKILRLYIGTQSYKEWLGQAICPQPIPLGTHWKPVQHSGHENSRKPNKNENGGEGEEGNNEEGEEDNAEEEDEEGNNEEEEEENNAEEEEDNAEGETGEAEEENGEGEEEDNGEGEEEE